MNEKKIYRYSNVELFYIIKNGTDKTQIEKAESEFNSRNMKNEQKAEIESDYLIYKKFQNERKHKPLTKEEQLTFFILPFFTPKRMGRDDHFTESEMVRYEKYGFHKKYQHAKKIRIFGYLFWLGLIIIGTLINLMSK